MRVSSSLAFVAAVRAVYLITRHPGDENRRLFLSAKNTLGRDNTGLDLLWSHRTKPRRWHYSAVIPARLMNARQRARST